MERVISDGNTFLLFYSQNRREIKETTREISFAFVDSPFGVLLASFSYIGMMGMTFIDRDCHDSEKLRAAALDRLRQKYPESNLQERHTSLSFDEKGLSMPSGFELSLHLIGTTFQLKVWRALLDIPRGEFRTYGRIAEHIGHHKAVRAVGTAVGDNPLPIIIPCHRVIAANCNAPFYSPGSYRYGSSLKLKILRAENGLSI